MHADSRLSVPESTEDGIDRYLVAGTCIGFDPGTGELYAPYGLDDVALGYLGPNTKNLLPDLSRQKVTSYQSRWPWLRIVQPSLHC